MRPITSHRFEEHVKRNIIHPNSEAEVKDGYGIVVHYNPQKNIASVLLAQPATDLPGEIYHNIPCPVQIGVQSVAPEVGRQCWVTFKNQNPAFPVITHFYNYFFETADYEKQTNAMAPMPRYIYNL
jgi:hypothetical protein